MRAALALLPLLLACADKGGDTGPGPGDGGSDDGGSDDGGSGDGGDGGGDGGSGDGGSTEEEGLLVLSGAATATDEGYTGTETVQFLADEGAGAVLCEVQLAFESTAPRTDCAECAWAWDLLVLQAETTVEGQCDTVGYGAAAVNALVGSTRAYGFNPEYFGHAPVLFVEGDAGWAAVAYAFYDEDTGEFLYDWEEGLYPTEPE